MWICAFLAISETEGGWVGDTFSINTLLSYFLIDEIFTALNENSE